MADRIRDLADRAHLAAIREADRLGKDSDTAALWCIDYLAEYACRLEDALHATVPMPWEPRQPIIDDSPAAWIDDLDRAYERRCRTEGVEP